MPRHTTRNVQCILCTENRPKAKLLPCSHDNICIMCARKISDSKCPTCRQTIDRVHWDGGRTSYHRLRSEYMRDEKRHLQDTLQLALVGPSTEDSQFIHDLLLRHNDRNYDNDVRQTAYSPNCSHNHTRKSRITVQSLPTNARPSTEEEMIEALDRRNSFVADAFVIVFFGLGEHTLPELQAWDQRARAVADVPVLWLLVHDGNLSVCGGRKRRELLRQRRGFDLRSNLSNKFRTVVKPRENRPYRREEIENLYRLLWTGGRDIDR